MTGNALVSGGFEVASVSGKVEFNFPSMPPQWLCAYVKHHGFKWNQHKRLWVAEETPHRRLIAHRALRRFLEEAEEAEKAK